MIIDGHVHAAREFADTEQIGKTLDGLGLDKILLCPSLKNNIRLPDAPRLPVPAGSADKLYLLNRICRLSYRRLIKDQGDGNAFVRTLAQRHPGRILQFYWANPLDHDCLERLERAHGDWSIRGIKLHQACDPFRIDGDGMRRIAEFAGERKLPVFIHLYSKEDARLFLEFAMDRPKTVFIVAHLIGLELAAGHAADLPNVYFELSGDDAVITEGRVQLALKAFGPERVVFGSDAPFVSPGHSLERARSWRIPEAHRERMLGGNLSALLSLE